MSWQIIAVEAKFRTLLNAEVQSEITSAFLLTRSAILRLLYLQLQLLRGHNSGTSSSSTKALNTLPLVRCIDGHSVEDLFETDWSDGVII